MIGARAMTRSSVGTRTAEMKKWQGVLNMFNSNGRLTGRDGRRRFALIVHMAAPILQGSYHRVVKDAMKADNKIKINQRRIDWFLYFFVNTLLPYFCEREIDGERGMNVVTHIKSMNILIEYNDLKAEGAFETMPQNSKYASFSAKIKYLGIVHTITYLYNLK